MQGAAGGFLVYPGVREGNGVGTFSRATGGGLPCYWMVGGMN